jgi:ribosomal protein S2
MKTGTDTFGIAENESVSAKHEKMDLTPSVSSKRVTARKTRKLDPTPSVLPKTSAGAKNMKTGPDVLSIVENESGSAKHDPMPGTAKHENGT